MVETLKNCLQLNYLYTHCYIHLIIKKLSVCILYCLLIRLTFPLFHVSTQTLWIPKDDNWDMDALVKEEK